MEYFDSIEDMVLCVSKLYLYPNPAKKGLNHEVGTKMVWMRAANRIQ